MTRSPTSILNIELYDSMLTTNFIFYYNTKLEERLGCHFHLSRYLSRAHSCLQYLLQFRGDDCHLNFTLIFWVTLWVTEGMVDAGAVSF